MPTLVVDPLKRQKNKIMPANIKGKGRKYGRSGMVAYKHGGRTVPGMYKAQDGVGNLTAAELAKLQALNKFNVQPRENIFGTTTNQQTEDIDTIMGKIPVPISPTTPPVPPTKPINPITFPGVTDPFINTPGGPVKKDVNPFGSTTIGGHEGRHPRKPGIQGFSGFRRGGSVGRNGVL